MKQFRKQLKLVSSTCVFTPRQIQLFTISPPISPPFHALSSDVQARPHCRHDRIPGYDHHDLHLGLCDR